MLDSFLDVMDRAIGRWGSGRYITLFVAVVYLGLTVWMMWPLPHVAGSAIQDPGDPLFEIWVMRWVQHALLHDPLHLYQANAFYGFDYSLAYSEEAISTALLAWPVYLLSGNAVLAYNVMFLGTFWLMAFGVFLLTRELGAHACAAFLAGVTAAFAPARFGHLSHLHMLWLGGFALVLWSITVFVRQGQRRYLVVTALLLSFVLLSSLHIAVFSTITLALFLPFLLLTERSVLRNRRTLAMLGVALVLPYLLLMPTLIPHLRVGEEYGFVRTRAEVESLSATPGSYLAVFPTNHLWGHVLRRSAEPFFPGAVTILGVLCAGFAWRRWPVRFGVLLGLVSITFSFGFSISLLGQRIPMPYTLLYDLVPPLRSIRGVGRYGLITTLALPLVAAFGYTAVWTMLRQRVRRHVVTLGLTLTMLLTLVACVELRSGVHTWHVPDDVAATETYDWLAAEPAGPIMEFPAAGLFHSAFANGDNLLQPIRYMYFSTRHWNPLVNGYSGFVPPRHLELIQRFADLDGKPSMVTPKNVGILQDLGVRWVVIHHLEGYDWQQAVQTADALPELRRRADFGSSTIYEVTDAGRESRSPVQASFDLPEVAVADSTYNLRLNLTNRNTNDALIGLHTTWSVSLDWTNAAGETVLRDSVPMPRPLTIAPGVTIVDARARVPATSGVYQLRAWASDSILESVEQQVDVRADAPDVPVLTLEGFDWDQGGPLRAGGVLYVTTRWRAEHVLAHDYAMTAQILTENGIWVAGDDYAPGEVIPYTTTLPVGHAFAVDFAVHIPTDLAPGSYQLLLAVYLPSGDMARPLIRLPDGMVAHELIIGGVQIQP